MKNPRTVLARMAQFCLDTVLPPRCAASGEVVSAQGLVAPHVWKALDFISAPYCPCCGEPFAFAFEGDQLCEHCQEAPPPFASARSALLYNDAARALLLGFKHGDKTHAVQAFVPWLARAGEDALASSDALIPVPLHYWRMVKRRYNQAALIAQALSKQSNRPVLKDALQRRRYTPSQGHLSRHLRADNVQGAFYVPPKKRALITGKTLTVIDDVYTTGATVKECAKILLENGAAAVHILTVARVPAPQT